MGFSFKKVFKKGEDRRVSNILRGRRGLELTGVEVGGDDEQEAVLLPPTSEGGADSPFEDGGAYLSPFERDGLEDGGLPPTTVVVRQSQMLELPPFDGGSHPSPFDLEEAGVASPVQQTRQPVQQSPFGPGCERIPADEAARDLENRGFRPLSSLPSGDAALPATPSMEQQPQRQPQAPTFPPREGFSSPFEIAAPGAALYSSEPSAPAAPSPFEVAPPPGQAMNTGLQFGAPGLPPQAQRGFPAPAPPQAPVPTGGIPQPIDLSHAAQRTGAASDFDDGSLDLPPGALEDLREFVELNVLQLLGSIPPSVLGVAELAISPFARARIPMAMLKPQLPTGQVFLNVSDVIVGCKPEHRAAMVGCDPTVRVKVPISMIFPVPGASQPPVMPERLEVEPSAPAQPAAVSGAQGGLAPIDSGELQQTVFGSPSTSPPQSQPPFSDRPSLIPASVADAGSNLAASPGLGGESAAVQSDARLDLPLVPPQPELGVSLQGVLPPFSALPPLGGGGSPQSVVPVESVVPPLPPMMSANAALAPTTGGSALPTAPLVPERSPAVPANPEPVHALGAWPFDGADSAAPPMVDDAPEALEDLLPVSEDGDFVVPPGFESVPAELDPLQSTLRGLFLDDGVIDPERVAAHCAELPGVENSVVLGGGGVLAAEGAGLGGFGDQAAKLHSCLLELMAAAGSSQSESFTICAGDAMVSFFAGDGLAIGVKHELQGFRPGVSERLTLIARELGKLAIEP